MLEICTAVTVPPLTGHFMGTVVAKWELKEALPVLKVFTPSRKSFGHRSDGAIFTSCLIWTVDSTAFSARYEVPSAHVTPTHLPFSTMNCSAGLFTRISPPCASRKRESANA